jgi:hypothetical protein
MLDKIKTLEGYRLDSLDGIIGSTKEFFFDDRHWTIRYLVAETGTWLEDRQVLISPYALTFPRWNPTSPSPGTTRRPSTSTTGGRHTGTARSPGATTRTWRGP